MSALYSGGNCYSSDGTLGSEYYVYVTGGTYSVPYQRTVEVYITADNTVIDVALLKIPANATKSSGQPVFSNLSKSYKNTSVHVQIANVSPASGCTLRDTYMSSVRNCFVSTDFDPDRGGGLCEDNDNDGICDDSDPFVDPDGNDPGIFPIP
ncbi:hypothetical protein [Fulvivirga ligni]|uniref:hypothetical protein n=1 Tax=Fulvivirga ligni TaxID=2904246 RepID=UPI001F170C5D|nr:hypothetical protein [Fulvivirga ligni]UII20941.1 hypothetical protein LVD16_24155 [Fulvivirga ligni]